METLFCYSCQRHHPKAEMRLFQTRHGQRWRCLQSIQAAQREQRERDSFGQAQSTLNREAKRHMAELRHHLLRYPGLTA